MSVLLISKNTSWRLHVQLKFNEGNRNGKYKRSRNGKIPLYILESMSLLLPVESRSIIEPSFLLGVKAYSNWRGKYMKKYESEIKQLKLLSVMELSENRVPAKRVDIVSLRMVKETSKRKTPSSL